MTSPATIMSDKEDTSTDSRGSSSGDESPVPPVSFYFGPQVAAAPETAYFQKYYVAPEKSRMPPGARELGILLNNSRRAAANNSTRGGATAWFDQDESGTYDPSEKRARKTPPPLSRRLKRVKVSASDKDGNPKPKRPMKRIGYLNSLVIKLSFKGKNALEYLKTLPAGISRSSPCNSNDEDEQVDVNPGSGSEGRWNFNRKRIVRKRARPVRPDGLTIDQLTDSHPQRRGCVPCFDQGNDECSLTHSTNYPCEACEDASVDCFLIVLPIFKKSCENCKVKRQKCSYREDGGKDTDSCDACEEGGYVCCAAPLRDEGWIKRFSGTPARPKVAKERARPRSNSALSSATMIKDPVQERTYTASNLCRHSGKRTNRCKLDTEPCASCRKGGQRCDFVHPRSCTVEPIASSSSNKSINKSRNKSKKKKAAIMSCGRGWDVDSPLPQLSSLGRMDTPPSNSSSTLTATIYSELEKNSGKKLLTSFETGEQHLLSPAHALDPHSYRRASLARTTTYNNGKYRKMDGSPPLVGRMLGIKKKFIVTAFCHPIRFNYIPDPLDKNPCSWCHNPLFGLWGLSDEKGPRKVECVYHDDGHGFEEISGGFSEAGHSRSTMCVECTFNRVRATQCGSHRMRTLDPIKGEIDMRVFDDEKWRQAIEEYSAGGNGSLVRKTKWCAICPATATTMCCTLQRFDAHGESGFCGEGGNYEGSETEGCGLYLCEDCAVLLEKMVKGGARTGGRQLDTLVNHVECNTWRYPEGVRADAPFMTSTGELLERMKQGTFLTDCLIQFSSASLHHPSDRKEVGKVFSGVGGGSGGPSRPDEGKSQHSLQTSSFGYIGKSMENKKGKYSDGVAGKARQQLSSRQATTYLAPMASKTLTSSSSTSSGVSKKADLVCTKMEGKKSRYVGCGESGSDSISPGQRGYKYGPLYQRSVGEGGKLDHRGEILFGGVMEARKEDVERALGGQNMPIDLTNE
ncbi:hypothetical protein QTJ16_003584 [Diplocarpon rosae]|uniref:C3H1-type domain-containing protein n=1 Tax=Diplocarpon rosae TaxID=946125 RepID=A0AAD9WET5_9HELO|nr:hypothetical protein QTJ16_003584 [Diplocarpon rosae]PBP23728.1 C6 zinc finger domain protein [Diplocarpon rosae]